MDVGDMYLKRECEPEDVDDEGYDDEDEDEDGYYNDEREDLIDGVGFADPGGESALRAATRNNPRNLPCGQCGAEDVLTPADKRNGYVCNNCARMNEGSMGEY